MEGMDQYITMIKEVGFPIFVALFCLLLVIWILKFMFNTIFTCTNLIDKNTDILNSIKEVTQKMWEKMLTGNGVKQ
jgi:ABC-type microcin C transport system permease subunit YejB